MIPSLTLFALLPTSSATVLEDEERSHELLTRYCVQCHGPDRTKAGLRLDTLTLRLDDPEVSETWAAVRERVADGDMPPEDAERRPSAEERKELVAWLDGVLTKARAETRIGGTLLRRLSRKEYENSIRDLFGFDFRTPSSFPADTTAHGFDNQGDGLVLSPPLMAQYLETATEVADRVAPPVRESVPSATVEIAPEGFERDADATFLHQDRLRLVTSYKNHGRSCTWPTRFQVKARGRYRIQVQASAFRPGAEPLRLELRARLSGSTLRTDVTTFRTLASFEVSSSDPLELRCDVDLLEGETVLIRFANGPLYSRPADTLADESIFRTAFADKRFHAAWRRLTYDRGSTAAKDWALMKELFAEIEVDPNDRRLGRTPKLAVQVRKRVCDVLAHRNDELGPGLDVHGATIVGPLGPLADPDLARRLGLEEAPLLPPRQGEDERTYLDAYLRPLLFAACRRPVPEAVASRYAEAALAHARERGRIEDGIHLAVRAILCSPDFLYRESRDGPLDDYGLAARLSFFLWSAPPDEQLYELAARGALSDPDVLAREAERLLAHERSAEFVTNFTGQWLGIRTIHEIMPDPRLVKRGVELQGAMVEETEMFFREILERNLDVATFLDSDFTYMNAALARNVYGRRDVRSVKTTRVSTEADPMRGGLLGQASVLMATANGVDTSPVTRGVWVLENLRGDPPPPPPEDVPAVLPDVSGAKTIRDRLSAHRADPRCHVCHVKIDPLGYALESFDAIGKYRSHYPVFEVGAKRRVTIRDGLPVDSRGVLVNGKPFEDLAGLKKLLVEDVDAFSRCLAEKLLIYATGRSMNFTERAAIDELVGRVREGGNGFRDLLLAVVRSEVFRTK